MQTSPVILVVKPECGLCDAAEAVVKEVATEFSLEVEIQSTAEEPKLAQQYGEEIPVLLVDGVVRDFWRIDPQRLRRLLAERSDG